MTETIPYDKVALDRKIMEQQNEYIRCSPVMLMLDVDKGCDPIPPDFPVWGAVCEGEIAIIFERYRLGEYDIDLNLFPYLDEVGMGDKYSFNDLKEMTIQERAQAAREHTIDVEFYLWCCRTNAHIR